jgi:hypothetical protein
VNLMEIEQYFCPYCLIWVPKQDYDSHNKKHESQIIDIPLTIEDMKRRFEPLGYYKESTN